MDVKRKYWSIQESGLSSYQLKQKGVKRYCIVHGDIKDERIDESFADLEWNWTKTKIKGDSEEELHDYMRTNYPNKKFIEHERLHLQV